MSVKTIFLIVFITLSLIVTYVFLFGYNSIDEVATGKIRYSKECGWINWEHAIPTGPSNLLAQIRSKTHRAGNKFFVRYSQKMKYSIAGKKLVAETLALYAIPLSITTSQEDEACLKILMHISEDFEKTQGSFPFSLIKEIRSSSFRSGDLKGNLLAYYLALHSLHRNRALDKLQLVPEQEALILWKNKSAEQEKTWKITFKSCFLNTMIEAANQSTIHPELLKQETRFYQE